MYMEALYPDRLGEDFLGLTTPGHQRPYPSDPWADGASGRLLAQSGDSAGSVWTRHALTVLIETDPLAPHRQFPALSISPPSTAADCQRPGGAALAALADLKNMDFGVLETIEACLPSRHSSLNAGMAALTQRLGIHLLEQTNDPAERAQIHHKISRRNHHTGLHQQGVKHAEEAVLLYRELMVENPARYREALASALDSFGIDLELTGQQSEALAATRRRRNFPGTRRQRQGRP